MKSPAFRFYPADFLTGTDDMGSAEVGAYIRLLSYSWLKGGLPDDAAKLIRLARWEDQSGFPDSVRSKFKAGDDGLLYNARLEEERAKQEEYSNRQRMNIEQRWKKHETPTQAEIVPKTQTPQRQPFTKPTREELLLAAAKIGLPEPEVDRFLNYYESNGWKVGKNAMKSWPHSLTNWKLNWETNRTSTPQKQNNTNPGWTQGQIEMMERTAVRDETGKLLF